jgi:hypothetical protein
VYPGRHRGRLALAAAAVAALAAPGGATAALSTSIVSASVAGPNAAMTEGDASVGCGGRLASGGGARMDQSVLSNGVHLVGSFPGSAAGGQSLDAEPSPTAWVGAGGIGGQAASAVRTWSYGVCVDGGPGSTVVVATKTAGPSGTFAGVLATATCPTGTRLLSGGARTTPGTIGSLKPNGSFPSDPAGAPVLAGANPTSWTAAGLNGSAGDADNTTHAFAICAAAGAGNPDVLVQSARVDGPADASTAAQVTTSCPAGSVLTGGGAYISDDFGLPGSQGDHLTGSFPSDPSGTPAPSGYAGSWTASSHSGGTVSGPLTDTSVWALCASEPPAATVGRGAAPPPPLPPTVIAPPRPIAGGVTASQIRESMRRQMTPHGQGSKIAVLLRRGSAKLPFKPLEAGRLTIAWYTARATVRGRRTRAVLLARGRRTFERSGAKTVAVTLTAAGKRALRGSTRVRLEARGEFTRRTGKPVTGTKAFVLTRDGATSSR